MDSAIAPKTQSRFLRTQATTFTARRIDTIIGRFYSVALLLASAEVTINALEQRHVLNPLPFWLVFALYLASNLALFANNWFFETDSRWYLVNALVIIGCVFAWPLLVPSAGDLPDDYTPFVWWMTGWGGISAGLSLNRFLTPVYIGVLAVSFAVIEHSPAGGDASLSVTVQNAVYTVLISSVLTGVVWLLQWQARRQDLAAEIAASVATETAAQEAIDDQRMRVSAVVHNEVLGALNAAAWAGSRQQQREASALAEGAIARLQSLENEEPASPTHLSAESIFGAITTLVQNRDAGISISSRVDGQLLVPIQVATAVTDATQQAVTNSLLHAGGTSVSRRVSMKATAGGLKISIVDDGKGFWMNRVPKNRLGIRLIIFERVRDAGAVAHLNSRPKEGTSVVLEWRLND